MQMLANPAVRLANNWLHDVGTGLWAACVLVIVVLDARKEALAAEAGSVFSEAVLGIELLVFWLLLGALADIALTGMLRLAYWRSQTPAEEMPAKRPALIGKHIAFLAVYGGGTLLTSLLVAR